MREIKFRGKTKENGKWVDGSYVYAHKWFGSGKAGHFIYDVYGDERVLIDENTLGQFTGLHDKNGNEIFEGDVVGCFDVYSGANFTAVVEFGNPNGDYVWGWQLRRISGDYVNFDILCWVEMEESGAFCEVIGNIYENPELLEVGE